MKAEKPVTLLTREGCAFDTRSAQAFVRNWWRAHFRGVRRENLRRVRAQGSSSSIKASTMKAGMNRLVFCDRPTTSRSGTRWSVRYGNRSAARPTLEFCRWFSNIPPRVIRKPPARKRACGSQPTVRGGSAFPNMGRSRQFLAALNRPD